MVHFAKSAVAVNADDRVIGYKVMIIKQSYINFESIKQQLVVKHT